MLCTTRLFPPQKPQWNAEARVINPHAQLSVVRTFSSVVPALGWVPLVGHMQERLCHLGRDDGAENELAHRARGLGAMSAANPSVMAFRECLARAAMARCTPRLAPHAYCIMIAVIAGVAELADAPDSKSGSRKRVWVRFPPPAYFTPMPQLLPARSGSNLPMITR